MIVLPWSPHRAFIYTYFFRLSKKLDLRRHILDNLVLRLHHLLHLIHPVSHLYDFVLDKLADLLLILRLVILQILKLALFKTELLKAFKHPLF